MAELKYEIEQKIACLSEKKNGWTKEFNIVFWIGNEAKYDIRAWALEHSKMCKGVTLSKEEPMFFSSVLNGYLSDYDK